MSLERQLALESEMTGQGASKHWKIVEKARANETESETKYAARLIGGDGKTAGALEAFSEAVAAFIKDGEGRPGRKHTLIPILKQFPSTDVVAFIALQVVFNGISQQKNLTNIAMLVGRNLEDELRFTLFEKENPAFWETLMKDLSKREHNMERRRFILLHEMVKGAKKQRSLRWKEWTAQDKCIVGYKVIHLLQESTGLVKIYRSRERHRTIEKITASPETLEWIEGYMAEIGIMNPAYLPTIIPPRKWKSPVGGGYYLKGLRPLKLVKVYGDRGNNYLQELGAMPKQMKLVYDAINAVQSTPWKINVPVLDLMLEAKASSLEIGKAPMSLTGNHKGEDAVTKMPLPPKPVDHETNLEARKEWKRKAAKVYSGRVRQISKCMQHTQLLSLAEKFRDEPTIYFPMQLDFRGRMYAVPSTLNPQGSDPAKGLLTFATGKPLGASGWRWLHIHAANMWGYDKVSLDDREKWTIDNYSWIVDCVHAPFDHREWMTADKPWQFIAAAMELVAAVESGDYESYVCSLPITVDGTCNGLQHFSAMLLDREGAIAVNLQPSETPQDIYQMVADRVKSRLIRVIEKGGEGKTPEEKVRSVEYSRTWLEWGFDRKATKRAVMIVPYSGTEYSAKEYTVDYIQDRKDCPFEDPFKPAYFFTKHVWAAIAEVIVSAKQVMNWLRKTGRAVSLKGATIIWTTPAGFPVKQDYREMTEFRVRTRIGHGITFQPQLRSVTNKLDKQAMEQAISPNFVHSLDAACLMLTVSRCVDDGLRHFAMVHDSYGTLAADMDHLGVALRQAFVDIYQTDVMGKFFREAASVLSEEEQGKIPKQPAKGEFQLELVKESKYFFA